jgi:hypothetical protein
MAGTTKYMMTQGAAAKINAAIKMKNPPALPAAFDVVGSEGVGDRDDVDVCTGRGGAGVAVGRGGGVFGGGGGGDDTEDRGCVVCLAGGLL